MGQPWRKLAEDFKWDDEHSEMLRKNVSISKGVQCIPTLLVFGPSGHGKSTFINSLSTISQNRKSNLTNCASIASHVTSVFRRYRLPGRLDTFQIADTKGIVLSKGGNKNLVEKIVSIINGHIRAGIEFDSGNFKENGSFYNDAPEESDKVHCVIFVLDITNFAKGQQPCAQYKSLVIELLDNLDRLDVPRIVVLTHADKIDTKVNDDIATIFHSEKVKDAVYAVKEAFGIPIENIHPVVNYSNTQFAGVNYKLHIPILLALESALNFAEDTLYKRLY